MVIVINEGNNVKYKIATETQVATTKPTYNHFIFIDMEMTGLDVNKDTVLEVACIVTDLDLNELGKCSYVVHESDDVLDNMDPWCIDVHGKSGLTQDSRSSKYSIDDVDELVHHFVSQFETDGVSPIVGNSIHQDKKFIDKYMPKLQKFFTYRMIDVSTIKELCKKWHPAVYDKFVKINAHRAIGDTYESIAELKYYREMKIV